ncbi:MAG: PEP-CTERM sorting domain-containing protein [Phycisphaeraceae bacterium]
MKPKLNAVVFGCLALLLSARASQAIVTVIDSSNITLAAWNTEVGADTTDNPDVTGGLGGAALGYTEAGTNAYACCGGRAGTFGIGNLNDGDVGLGNFSDGSYAIPTAGAGAVVLDFGGALGLTRIAIYNGYGNRTDGTYTLKDAANNTLGAWTISGTAGGGNAGVDSFWLTFNTPVITSQLILDTTSTENATNSFREIQVFNAPLPTAFSPPTVQLSAKQLALNNGDTVTTWGGQTAGGTPTFLTGQTPNGMQAVQFNGTDRMGDNVFVPADNGDFIIALVVKPNSIGAYHNLLDDDVQNRPMLWVDTTFNYEANFGGGTGAKAAGTGTDGWDIVIFDSRTNQLFVNSPTPNATGGGAVPFTAGEFFDFLNRDGGQTFQGLLAELRIYNNRIAFGGDFDALYNELVQTWFVAVPEPATFGLFAVSALALLRRRRAGA